MTSSVPVFGSERCRRPAARSVQSRRRSVVFHNGPSPCSAPTSRTISGLRMVVIAVAVFGGWSAVRAVHERVAGSEELTDAGALHDGAGTPAVDHEVGEVPGRLQVAHPDRTAGVAERRWAVPVEGVALPIEGGAGAG